MQYEEKVQQALDYIRTNTDIQPEAAVALGSGLGKLAGRIENAVIIPYADIPWWPRSTAPGHAGRLAVGLLGGRAIVAMQGRVHFYEGYTMQEVTFPVRVLGSWGIKAYVATNASGGVNSELAPGTITALTDHINFMGTNPLIGQNNDAWGARFPDMTHAYDAEFNDLLEKIAKRESIKFARGVYAALTGPSFETPAEIRMLRTFGADVVGMSTVPEVIAANHMGIRTCALSCVANAAAGITGDKLTHQEVLDNMAKTADALCLLMEAFLAEAKL